MGFFYYLLLQWYNADYNTLLSRVKCTIWSLCQCSRISAVEHWAGRSQDLPYYDLAKKSENFSRCTTVCLYSLFLSHVSFLFDWVHQMHLGLHASRDENWELVTKTVTYLCWYFVLWDFLFSITFYFLFILICSLLISFPIFFLRCRFQLFFKWKPKYNRLSMARLKYKVLNFKYLLYIYGSFFILYQSVSHWFALALRLILFPFDNFFTAP